MSELDEYTQKPTGEESFFNRALVWCKKNLTVVLTLVSIFTIAIAIAVPVYWQFSQHPDWGFIGIWRHVFSGSIDWSAWWAFSTFAVALLAAIIAYREFALHRDDLWDNTRAHIQITYFIVKTAIYIRISNVGKTTAADVQVHLNGDPDKINSALTKLIKWQKISSESEASNEAIAGGIRKGAMDRAISSIAPGSGITFLLGFVANLHALDEFSRKLEGSVVYKDYKEKNSYNEKFVLDFDDARYMAWPPSNMDQINESLKTIAEKK